MSTVEAIERCAYCREYAPVTDLPVKPVDSNSPLRARVTVCETCFEDGL